MCRLKLTTRSKSTPLQKEQFRGVRFQCARVRGVSFTMKRFFLLCLLVTTVADSSEYEKCLDREYVHRETMIAPRVTGLRGGSVLVSAVIEANGKVSSSKILDQEGHPRWGKAAIIAIEKSSFAKAEKPCRFETRYTAKFEKPKNEN